MTNNSICFLLQPIYAIWFNAESILLFLKQDPEVARLAALYLKWMSLGLPGSYLVAMVYGLRTHSTSSDQRTHSMRSADGTFSLKVGRVVHLAVYVLLPSDVTSRIVHRANTDYPCGRPSKYSAQLLPWLVLTETCHLPCSFAKADFSQSGALAGVVSVSLEHLSPLPSRSMSSQFSLSSTVSSTLPQSRGTQLAVVPSPTLVFWSSSVLQVLLRLHPNGGLGSSSRWRLAC